MILEIDTIVSHSSAKRPRNSPSAARPKGEGVELSDYSQAALPFLLLLIARAFEDETLHQCIESAYQDQ
jgi:hypothetical protein